MLKRTRDLLQNIENAPSQETLVLGTSQPFELDDDEVDQVNERLTKRPRLEKVRVHNVKCSPRALYGFVDVCLNHPRITTLIAPVYSTVSSVSQKPLMRLLEDLPESVEVHTAKRAENLRAYMYFRFHNFKTLKMTEVVEQDGQQVERELSVHIPDAVLEKYLRPYLVGPLKTFTF